MKPLPILLLAGLCALSPPAPAHGTGDHVKSPGAVRKAQTAWGIAGDPRAAKRTVEVRMSDTMRFTPERIDVRAGETVRFIIHNAGKVMHEFVLGTREVVEEHAELMKKFPNMEHDEPHMAHVAPGRKGEIVWTFNRTGEFDFACLLPGHFDSGMKGTVRVAAR